LNLSEINEGFLEKGKKGSFAWKNFGPAIPAPGGTNPIATPLVGSEIQW